jgi:ATP synthase protein I
MRLHDPISALPPVEQAPEPIVARDLARRGLLVAPVAVLVAGLVWGVDGALSALFGLALVVVNLLAAAAMLAWAARISPAVLMATALGGMLLRLGVLTAVVLLVKDLPWVEVVPLGITIVVTHLFLLVWESRHVSASLAYPVLKPAPGGLRKEKTHS